MKSGGLADCVVGGASVPTHSTPCNGKNADRRHWTLLANWMVVRVKAPAYRRG
jgi:hypothetical protein